MKFKILCVLCVASLFAAATAEDSKIPPAETGAAEEEESAELPEPEPLPEGNTPGRYVLVEGAAAGDARRMYRIDTQTGRTWFQYKVAVRGGDIPFWYEIMEATAPGVREAIQREAAGGRDPSKTKPAKTRR